MDLLDDFSPEMLRAAVLGANDGIITTFAVVAGVVGANLPARTIIILGIANMVADGVSMGIGDYLGRRSEAQMREHQEDGYERGTLWRSGVATFVAFVIAGTMPLLPYLLNAVGVPIGTSNRFLYASIATAAALFLVGSLRTVFTKGAWWENGLKMLGIGAIAAVIAYFLGSFVEGLTRQGGGQGSAALLRLFG